MQLSPVDLLREFVIFGTKQVMACVFAGSFFVLLILSHWLTIPGLPRYDFLFLGALTIQILLIALRLETPREVMVLSLFHAIGMGLELFKTSPGVGSWAYPDAAYFRLGTVPLYSGFMYAAVASYMIQAWRLLDLRLTGFPSWRVSLVLAGLIYGNFFSNHYVSDMRWVLAAILLWVFRRTFVHFTVSDRERRMPLMLSFLLIGFFVWIAENLATYFGAWVYPDQTQQWVIVGPHKISSWMLLVVISFLIVASLQRSYIGREAAAAAPGESKIEPRRRHPALLSSLDDRSRRRGTRQPDQPGYSHTPADAGHQ